MNNVQHQQQTQPGSHHHFEDKEDDEVAGGGGVEDSVDNPHPNHQSHSQIQYDAADPHSHTLHNGSGDGESTPTMDEAMNGGVDGVGGQHALYVPGSSEIVPSPTVGGGADQLTLSFQGEVYVFDSVSPEKVQAVLLLLGGYEVPTDVPAIGGMPSHSHRNVGEFPGRSSQPQRAASLNRFREKRKERCFDKKTRYTVRREVALRMHRKRGQFTSSKSISDEVGSSSSEYNIMAGQEEQETPCKHCGISSKSTPMMRRGPAGPRTLCNACGLKWANKGVLRDISKTPLILRRSGQSNGKVNHSDAVTAAVGVITSSNGDNSAQTAEQ